MDTENNAMHMNPKHKRCMKKDLVNNLKTKNFSVSIDRVTIKYQSSQAGSNQKILTHFRSVKKHLRSIKNIEK